MRETLFGCVSSSSVVQPEFGREQTMREVVASLPSVQHVIHVGSGGRSSDWIGFESLERGEALEPRYEPMSFSDPVYILFTSGTTGPPKCICQASVSGLLPFSDLLSFEQGIRGDVDTSERARSACRHYGQRRRV